MDINGESARALIAALGECNERLRLFASSLYFRKMYRQYPGSYWRSGCGFGGGWYSNRVYKHEGPYERIVILSASIHRSAKRAIWFGVHLGCTAEAWTVDADIEYYDEDDKGEIYVWELPKIPAGSFEEAMTSVENVTGQLIDQGELLDLDNFLS